MTSVLVVFHGVSLLMCMREELGLVLGFSLSCSSALFLLLVLSFVVDVRVLCVGWWHVEIRDTL